MHTKTVGQLLKEERARRQLSLESLSKKTRIRQQYLESIEAGEYGQLPAATFVKGYIKRYSATLGLDHQPLLALLRRDYKESAKGTLVPREFIKPLLKQRQKLSSVTVITVLLGSLFVTLFFYISVQWYNLNKPPELTITKPADQARVSSKVIVEGQTSPQAQISVNDQPVAILQDGSFSSEIFLLSQGASTITVDAKDRRGKTSRVQRTVYVEF